MLKISHIAPRLIIGASAAKANFVRNAGPVSYPNLPARPPRRLVI